MCDSRGQIRAESILELQRRRPCVAVHANRGLGPVSRKDAAAGCRLMAELRRHAVVGIDLRRHLVRARAPQPAVAEEGVVAADEEEVRDVLQRIGEVTGVAAAAAGRKGVFQVASSRRARCRAQRAERGGACARPHQRRRAAAVLGIGRALTLHAQEQMRGGGGR